MAIITSSVSKVAVRKSTRQERRTKARPSYRSCTTSAAVTPKKRGPKRRKLNDHSSEWDDRCADLSEPQTPYTHPDVFGGTRPHSKGKLIFF